MTLLKLTSFNEILSRWNNSAAISLNIQLIDEYIGGLLPSQLHMVQGTSGSGKTWFCFRAIACLFRTKFDAQVLYSDFQGHVRIRNLKKLLSNSYQLDQIIFCQPTNLLEQIIFFQNLIEDNKDFYDLIILDTFLGSPLDSIHYFHESKMWCRQIFSHLSNLRQLAKKNKIPILLTNHITQVSNNSTTDTVFKQYGEAILEPLVPINFIIEKIKGNFVVELKVFQESIGRTDFVLIPFNK